MTDERPDVPTDDASAPPPSGLRGSLAGSHPAPPPPGSGAAPGQGDGPPTSPFGKIGSGPMPRVTADPPAPSSATGWAGADGPTAPAGPPADPTVVAPVGAGGGSNDTGGGGEPTAPRRSRKRLALVAAGVVALAGAGYFVTQGLGGKGGGADSPEAAVRQLSDALSKEDPAAAAAVLAPDEVRTFSELVDTVESRVSKAGVTSKDPYAGLSLDVEDLDLDVEEESDTVARVDISNGEARWKIDRKELPEKIRTASDGADTSGTIDEDDLVVEYWDDSGTADEIDPFLMVVKRGGGWYVSPTYTIAAYLAEANGYPEGDFGEEVPEGLKAAETPEEAVLSMAESVDELDARSTLESLPSQEWSVLWVYRDAIEDLVDEETSNGEGFELDVDDQELEVSDLPNGFKKVTITQAEGTLTTTNSYGERERFDWELDGQCFKSTGSNGAGRSCLDGGDDYDGLIDDIGIEEPFVVVAKDRGGWVVSPTATVLQYADEIIPKVSDAWAYRLLGAEWFAPTDGTAAIGKVTKGTFNEAGFATYDLKLGKGERWAVGSLSDDADLDLYDPHGDYFYDYYEELGAGWRSVHGDDMGVDDAGTYRIVVSGKPKDDFSFQFSPVKVEGLEKRQVSGTLTDAMPVVEYRFTVPEDQVLDLESSAGGYEASIVTDDGDYVGYDEGIELDSSETYRLRVARSSGEGDTRFDVELVEPPRVSIDGVTTVTGYLSGTGESATHDLVVGEGVTATITLSGDGYDFDLYCEDDSGSEECSSGAGATSSESDQVYGPVEGTVRVRAYSGSGSYTLTISE